MLRLDKLGLGLFGLLALAASRLICLSQAPGFHYDEAWAANFAHRIATEPGFWPLAAQSPYTSASGHYIAAAFFRIFGTNLFVYRSSGIALMVAGAFLLMRALRGFGEARAALILPWLLAFSVTLAINERFVIDLTSFHAFCLGLFAFGISLFYRRIPAWGALWTTLAVLFGVTSHVLFIGVALAALGAILLNRRGNGMSRVDSLTIGLCGLGCLAFFVRIFLNIPEKDKALSLISVTISALALALLPPLRKRFTHEKFQRGLRYVINALALPGCALLIFFWEGSWALLFFTGTIAYPALIGLNLIAPLLCLVSYRAIDRRALPPGFFDFWALTILITSALAVKPTPRYFEIPLVLGAVFFSMVLARLPKKIGAGITLLWIAASTLVFSINYLRPQIEDSAPKNLSYHFLFFRDGTGDTLNKQRLVQQLSKEGYGPQQVITHDSRLSEELRFLAIGDWPVARANGRTETITNWPPRVRLTR
ncbi:MAG: hypothetical protein P4M08_03515 [Oligoflexia bacterium]|nr:hypothetical protein [Oligoflexia bacterium]